MSITKKVIAAFAAVAVVFIGSMVFMYVQLMVMSKNAEVRSAYGEALLRKYGNIYADGLQCGQAVRNIILNPSDEKARANHQNAMEAMSRTLTEAEALIVRYEPDSVGTLGRIRTVRRQWDAEVALQNEIVGLVSQKRTNEAVALLNSRETALWRDVKQLALDLRKEHLVRMEQDRVRNEAALASRATLSIAIAGLGVVLLSAIGVFISRIIVRPIVMVARQLGSANLNMTFNATRQDEIGQLQQAFDSFVTSIRQTLIQVTHSTAAVASASAEISSSTEEMAAGAQEQSNQAGEVASAVEEMTKTIVENSRTASATAEFARKAKEAAENGVAISEGSLDAIRRNVEVAGEVGAVVNELGQSSEKIGDIITVIDDIADQTNLLALNAAIEAARAGEQGRGFAVVADEVRKLAERTTKATKEIADLIKSIQGLTTKGVRSMEKAGGIVNENREMTNKTAEALKGIVEVSAQVTDMVGQIAAASEEQSSASEQISKNVEAISTVTQQTASGTQQIARAAEDLNRLTEKLQQLVGKFSIVEDGYRADAQDAGRTLPSRSAAAVRANGTLVEAVSVG